jgi:NAD(P)-dependent dehydrogenase (short-subunit alcohol dehydrogenase family)
MTDATSSTNSMAGKTVVITGGNAGIGKEAAVGLAEMGARVVITARDAGRGEAALAEIKERSGSDNVEVMPLDLANTKSIRAFASDAQQRLERIDVLVNNAGLVLGSRSETDDGFETTFGVNHLGHFLLTDLLLERLQASAPSRIVVVASHAHKQARHGLNFDDLQSKRRYRPFRTYSQTKLANILFTRELARRLEGTNVTVNALHPGFVASRFGKDGDIGWIGRVGMPLARPFAISPEKGARTTIYLASSPDVEGLTGHYFFKCAPVTPSKAALDDTAATRLWQVSEQLLASTGA